MDSKTSVAKEETPEDSDEEERIIHLADTETASNQCHETLWFAKKDNELKDNIPIFLEHNTCGEMLIDYFDKMIPDNFLKSIVYESNLYATRKGNENFALTVPELKVFLGINFILTYLRYTRLQHYWTSKYGTRLSIITDHMTKKRFEEIRKYLHFVSDDVHKNEKDNLFTIRPVLNHFSKVLKEAYDPEEYLSIDKMIIPFKGRAKLKQHIRSKPHP